MHCKSENVLASRKEAIKLPNGGTGLRVDIDNNKRKIACRHYYKLVEM